MAHLEIDRLTKRYGEFRAVDDVSLDVKDGEFLVLLGPSGCGKTTTLRAVAGFIEPTAGAVRLGGRDITALPPWKRNAGLVFQSYALFPHMTVADNVAFGLEMRKVPRADMAPKIAEALRLVRLGHLGDRLPRQLSGGQQQRVALARALVFRPDVLLLDEPLSNLDAKLRQEVRVEIRELQRTLGLTTVMVTHDQEEAPLDYAKLKNAGNLLASMKYPYGIGHIYSGKVAVFNPKMITPAPVSYKNVFDPKHGNKLGIIDIQYQYTLVCAALAAGGRINDLEPGKKLLLECKKTGMRIYPTNEAFAQGLKSEEFGIGVMWKARVVQWQNAGITVEAVSPSEGTLAYVSGFVIPKNAPNKDGAYAYLDAMLEKSAQENFAIDMGYNPTVTNATVAPDLNKRIGFTPGEIEKLVDLDYDYMNKNDVALKEWWDKELKG